MVVRILHNEKLVCKFNYWEHKHYSLPRLELFSKNRDTIEVDPENDEMEYKEEDTEEHIEVDDYKDDK